MDAEAKILVRGLATLMFIAVIVIGSMAFIFAVAVR